MTTSLRSDSPGIRFSPKIRHMGQHNISVPVAWELNPLSARADISSGARGLYFMGESFQDYS